MPDPLLALAVILAAFAIALAVLMVFAAIDRRKTSNLRRFSADEREAIVFIFENETLIDATPAARQFMETAPLRGTAWTHLTSLLQPRFPRLNEWIQDLAMMGEMEVRSSDGGNALKAEWHDGVARVTLSTTDKESDFVPLDRHSQNAMSHELESLRANAEHMPFPVWREDLSGTITWCNRAYLELVDSAEGQTQNRPWPPRRVFDLSDMPSPDELAAKGESFRVAFTPFESKRRHWFDVTEHSLPDSSLFSASPADRIVHAETSLNEFVTTLTKTFATLPIGLAIFDRHRELALFNPALMDLTMLPVDLLCAKPTLSTFLDRLREQRMMPEPKDYKSWRQRLSDLVDEARNGTYEETWALPTGQTYRVTGRPHPDGAIAFLFEDISAEVSLTRRFRTELDTGQATLDALPQAIAVFSPNGILSLSNTAYAELWGFDPSTSLEELSLADAADRWKAVCSPSHIWSDLRAFASKMGRRDAWSAPVTLKDGRTLSCQVKPLAHGATMVSFSHTSAFPTDNAPRYSEPAFVPNPSATAAEG
ncbi:MAG: PAS-domain containing protein [Maritimibacter sp.]